VRVEPKPLDLLILLVSRKGHLVTRREIVEKLWKSDVFVDTDHSINTAIRKLRYLLQDDSETPKYIETVTGIGYRFVAPISQLEREGTGATADIPIPSLATSIQGELKAESVDNNSFDQASSTTSADPDPDPEVHRPARRWYWAVAIVALVVIPVLLVHWLDRPEPPLPKIIRTVQLTSDGREKFPQIVTDGVRAYFAEVIDNRWTLSAVPVSGGEPTAIPLPFPNVQVIGISPDKSELLIGEGAPISEYPLWRVPILGGSPRRMGNIVAHDGGWSPDGRSFMFMQGIDVYLANGDGSEPRKIELPPITPNTWSWSPRWSPDGSRITFDRYIMDKHLSSIWEVSARGEHPHRLLPNWQEPPMQCCGVWTPDGSFFFFDAWKHLEGGAPLAPAPDLWALRKSYSFLHQTRAEPTQLTAGPVHYFTHVFSADGRSLIALSTQRREELSQFDPKTQKFSPYPGLGPANSISFSHDGWVAYVKFPQGELWRKKADGSESLQLTFRPLMVFGPHWSPDGKQIVFCGQEPGQEYALYLVSADGGEVRRIRQETRAYGLAPHWSADGTSILFWSNIDGTSLDIEVFNLHTQQLSKLPGSEGMGSPMPSPDGKYISAISDDRRLTLFDVKKGKWTTLLDDVRSQAWSSDGRSIYFISSRQPDVLRFSLATRQVRQVASLRGLKISDTFGPELFLTPKDEILVRQQTELETEIYALFWDQH
jgi:Tol biopolymer transport system component/DNA-binding winged helix-turn-helix (wHTH) protein